VAVEALHLAVGLWPIRLGEALLSAEFGDGLAEATGVAVVAGVVGQHALDGDAMGGEERRGAAQEPRAGLAPLVGQDLHVGQPGVVVHSGVDIVVARAAARSGGADPVLGGRPAVDAVATAGTQPAELLDIEVEQLAGVGAFVVADDPAGWPVHDGQPVEAQPAKDAVDGGGRPADQRLDPCRAELADPA